MTRVVTGCAKNACMNTQHYYVVPKGTRVKARNVKSDLKLRQHVTKVDLIFDQVSCTGDGATLTYFRRLNWLVVVETENIVKQHAEVSDVGRTEFVTKMAG